MTNNGSYGIPSRGFKALVKVLGPLTEKKLSLSVVMRTCSLAYEIRIPLLLADVL